MNIAFVWPAKNWDTIEKIGGGHEYCSVVLWPTVMDCDVIGWKWGEFYPKPEWKQYDLFIVNHFGYDEPVAQLRRSFPKAKILALVDPALEVVLEDTETYNRMLPDLAAADAFGGRTKYDAMFYQALLGIKSFWLPSPIGFYSAFDKYRKPFHKRQDYVVTLDHVQEYKTTAQNIAFGKMLYKSFGLKTKYVRTRDTTRATADMVGHDGIELLDWMGYGEFCELVSNCRFGYDLYNMHSQGRNEQTFAMCKTPIIGSRTTNRFGGIEIDPFDLDGAMTWAYKLMLQEDIWGQIAAASLNYTERNYGFEASWRRMDHITRWMMTQ